MTDADGLLAPVWANHHHGKMACSCKLESFDKLVTNYAEKGLFLLWNEAEEHLIQTIDLLGLPHLVFIDILLQTNIVNFCVNLEKDRKNANRRGSELKPLNYKNEATAAADSDKLPSALRNSIDIELYLV